MREGRDPWDENEKERYCRGRHAVILHLFALYSISFLPYRGHQSLPLSSFISPPLLMINLDMLSSLCALTSFMSFPTLSLKKKFTPKLEIYLLTHLLVTPNPYVAYFMQKKLKLA